MKPLACFLLIFLFHTVIGQQPDGALEAVASWQALDSNRVKITTTGMCILGGWALGNLTVNPILQAKAEGSQKYFYQMNSIWNVVNLGLAGASLWQSMRGNAGAADWQAAYSEQHSVERIFLVNTALDVAYMAGGLYMIERSKNALKQSDRLNGFGKGVLLQGGFLFVFDLSMYLVQHSAQKDWARILQNVNLGPEGIGMIIPLR
ncbi:hypothetical protein [uncultured Imperialibacter sp.]|uniref:DUF6992 family protein n=1 Tax=uncultured Imperialibacter sp. TaxID=1672639 RepID=UPI0030D9705D|tara:strand:- start:29100 stop:29714 length:615 start_codon:yes stop_codon:yes gene_type:complete